MTATAQGNRVLEITALPSPTLPAATRAQFALRLDTWGLILTEESRHDLYLAASEMVTNACKATPKDDITSIPTEKITFRAELRLTGIWIGVWDASSDTPTSRLPELDLATLDALPADDDGFVKDVGGWGLPLVSAVSAHRGGISWTNPKGKWIWALFSS